MVKDQKSPHKTDHADQTVSRRDLKLGGMVVLSSTTMWPRLAPIGLTGALQQPKVQNHSLLLNCQSQTQMSYVVGILGSPRTKHASDLIVCMIKFEHLWLKVKGIVHPKMKMMSPFTHPQVVPNLFECLCSAEHKGRYSEECEKQSNSGLGHHWLP